MGCEVHENECLLFRSGHHRRLCPVRPTRSACRDDGTLCRGPYAFCGRVRRGLVDGWRSIRGNRPRDDSEDLQPDWAAGVVGGIVGWSLVRLFSGWLDPRYLVASGALIQLVKF